MAALVGNRYRPLVRRTGQRHDTSAVVITGSLGFFALLVLSVALKGPANVAIGAAVFLCLLSAAVISRLSVAQLGVVLTIGFCFTASWDEVTVAGIKPRTVLLGLALIMLIFGHGINHPPRLPWWLYLLAATASLVTLFQALLPISARYLSARYLTSQQGQDLGVRPGAFPSLLSFLFNTLAVPTTIVLACTATAFALRPIIYAYVSGVTVSCLAAYLGFQGHPFLLTSLVPVVPTAGLRATGYGSHPLHLATSAVFATGLACWMAVQPGFWVRWIGRASIVSLLLGLYASGSRAGNAVGVLIVAACAVLLPAVRRRIHITAAVVIVLLAGVVAFVPSFGLAVLRTTRIYGSSDGAASDEGRGQVLDQGLTDFKQSPVYGIGVRYISEAHTLYPAILASGGLVLAVAYVAFNIGSLRDALRVFRLDRSLGGAVLATLVGSLVYWGIADEFAVASVTIVYGLLIALSAGARVDGGAEPDVVPRAGRSSDRAPSGRARPLPAEAATHASRASAAVDR